MCAQERLWLSNLFCGSSSEMFAKKLRKEVARSRMLMSCSVLLSRSFRSTARRYWLSEAYVREVRGVDVLQVDRASHLGDRSQIFKRVAPHKNNLNLSRAGLSKNRVCSRELNMVKVSATFVKQ
jgi:hypothetical protein